MNTIVKWVALEFTRLDIKMIMFISFHCLLNNMCSNVKYITCDECFNTKLNNFKTILGEPLYPMFIVTWCISFPHNVSPLIQKEQDSKLAYYVRITMDYYSCNLLLHKCKNYYFSFCLPFLTFFLGPQNCVLFNGLIDLSTI